jgi:peptidyl-prolyl cis-trans isomerase SurA
MRDYLTTMREQAYIDIKPGFVDSGASAKQIKPVYSAYAPPAPKKKKKVERTRFRESTRTFRQKSPQTAAAPAAPAKKQNVSADTTASMKPGKKEKIRFGQAPTKTLPTAATAKVEDAGAVQPVSAAPEPENPLEAVAKPTQKTRFSARPKVAKKPQPTGAAPGALSAPAPDAGEVADRQTQSAPLGLAGDTSASKKKKNATTKTDKKRMTNKEKKPEAAAPTLGDAPAPSTPAPAPKP